MASFFIHQKFRAAFLSLHRLYIIFSQICCRLTWQIIEKAHAVHGYSKDHCCAYRDSIKNPVALLKTMAFDSSLVSGK